MVATWSTREFDANPRVRIGQRGVRLGAWPGILTGRTCQAFLCSDLQPCPASIAALVLPARLYRCRTWCFSKSVPQSPPTRGAQRMAQGLAAATQNPVTASYGNLRHTVACGLRSIKPNNCCVSVRASSRPKECPMTKPRTRPLGLVW